MDFDFPHLEPNEVLIKVAYAPIHPHDKHIYNSSKQEGLSLGYEGSGTVVDFGSDADQSLKNKKVAFMDLVNCTFKQYIVV